MNTAEIAKWERRVVVIAKRKGNSVRWRNKETGLWDKGWFALFVHVPKDFDIVGMNADEFNQASKEQGWVGR